MISNLSNINLINGRSGKGPAKKFWVRETGTITLN
jgi:hypothetical protein